MTYDVSSDPLRYRVAEIIDDYGIRVQWSVFECDLDDGKLAEMRRRLEGALADAEAANVRLYGICSRCAGLVLELGQSGVPKSGKYVVL